MSDSGRELRDDILRSRLARAFAARGYDVREAASAAAAEPLARGEAPELVVLDLPMPDSDGLDPIPVLLQADPNTRVVVLTGSGSVGQRGIRDRGHPPG